MTSRGQSRHWRELDLGGVPGPHAGDAPGLDDVREAPATSGITVASSFTAPETAFGLLTGAERVWAVGAVFADVHRLHALHRALWPRIRRNDRLVYLGNMIGRGAAILETIDQLLEFRIAFLARPHADPEHLVYLRGAQEEMWQKLLQLQFAPDPPEVMRYLLANGVAPTIRSYGGDPERAMMVAREGAVSLTRWTNLLRMAVRSRPGHEPFFAALKRAAYTGENGVLFVSAGLDPARPLRLQKDRFWWEADGFARLEGPYQGFARVVRGHDPAHGGIHHNEWCTTLDGGCGYDGTLVAACFAPDGAILDVIEV
jgi:serine/threonine protein phosphatase 1